MLDSDMDWGDIASTQLPTLSKNTQWTRDLSQLQSFSTSFLQNQQQSGAPSILSNNLGGSISNTSIDFLFKKDPASVIEGSSLLEGGATSVGDLHQTGRRYESLDDLVARHENNIIHGIIERTSERTRLSVENFVDERLHTMLEIDRSKWMRKVLGSSLGDQPIQIPHGLPMGREVQLSADSLQLQIFEASADRGSDVNVKFDNVTGFLDPYLAHQHLKAVDEMMPFASNSQQRVVAPELVLDRLYRTVLEQQSQQNVNFSILTPYASSLQLVSELLKATSTPGPVGQARGSLTHLSRQFLAYVKKVAFHSKSLNVESSTFQTTFSSMTANQCSVFVEVEFGITLNSSQQRWAIIYYCLRSGDAAAAYEVLQGQPSVSGADAPLNRILNAMAKMQGASDCMWLLPVPRLEVDDLSAMDKLFENAKRQDPSDVHRIGVYSLFASSSHPETSDSTVGFKTIEDYLTLSLFSSLVRDQPLNHLIQLGKVISQEFGMSYFEDPSSGGWSFTLPLLLTQQYRRALVYLVEAGGAMGLLSAVHIGLFLFRVGIPLRDLVSNSTENDNDGVLTSLLTSYSSLLLRDPVNLGSVMAMQYLVRIPYIQLAKKEVSKLIAQTLDIERLVGTINEDGNRQNSFLESYFNPSDISMILKDSASILLRERDDPQKLGSAMMCLMLGESFTEVLEMLNELLSPPNRPDQHRKFWITQTESFHTHYLRKRTHVVDVLERTGKTSLIKQSEILLQLNAFEELFAAEKFNEAWKIAESLNLIPTNHSDMVSKQSIYQTADKFTKGAYPSFLNGVTEICYLNYSFLKQQYAVERSDVISDRLNALREQARLIASFAASIGQNSEKIGNISTLCSLMI